MFDCGFKFASLVLLSIIAFYGFEALKFSGYTITLLLFTGKFVTTTVIEKSRSNLE